MITTEVTNASLAMGCLHIVLSLSSGTWKAKDWQTHRQAMLSSAKLKIQHIMMPIQLNERQPMPSFDFTAVFDADKKYAGSQAPQIAKKKLIANNREWLGAQLSRVIDGIHATSC